jgi:hypothetical protein
MTHRLFIICSIACLLFACNETKKEKKEIKLGDTSEIVTEIDSNFLGNHTEDISPTNKRSSESQIAKMMVQVDSLNTSKKLEDKSLDVSNVNGLSISFKECEIIFDNIFAHKTIPSQEASTSNELSYKRDGGELLDQLIQVNGIENAQVAERITTMLAIEKESEKYILEDLGKYTTQWFNLAGKDLKFVSLGSNSLQFREVNQSKIKNALDRELRKKNKSAAQIKNWMKEIANTKSHTDVPCKLLISSIQWRIKGDKNGKKVQKTITIEN